MNQHQSVQLQVSHIEASLNRASDHLHAEQRALDEGVESLAQFIAEARQMMTQLLNEQLQGEADASAGIRN